MPNKRTYKAGSVIYFEHDSSEEIYLLKAGKVSLTYTSLETNKEVNEHIKMGEFFGVRSTLGKYPREETAQVLTDSVVFVFNLQEFENLALKNVNLVKKMLRIYSNNLRKIGKFVNKKLSDGEEGISEPSFELFKIGEYYLKNKLYSQAEYAFSKYVEHYPDGEYVKEAHSRIQLARRGVSNFKPVSKDDDDTGTTKTETKTKKAPPKKAEAQPTEDSAKLPEIDEPEEIGMEIDEDDEAEPVEPEEIEIPDDFKELYDKAKSMLVKKDYDNTVKKIRGGLKKIERDEFNQDGYDSCVLLSAKANFMLENYESAIEELNRIIKQESEPVMRILKEAFLIIGHSYLKLEDEDKAVRYLKRLLSMPPHDTIVESAEQLLEEHDLDYF